MPAIGALLAPEIARGQRPPTPVRAEEFLVASTPGGELIGAVALRPLAPGVLEFGSTVAVPRGLGIGRRLVEAAMAWAATRGRRAVIIMAGTPRFFKRRGFSAPPDAAVPGATCSRVVEVRLVRPAVAIEVRVA